MQDHITNVKNKKYSETYIIYCKFTLTNFVQLIYFYILRIFYQKIILIRRSENKIKIKNKKY